MLAGVECDGLTQRTREGLDFWLQCCSHWDLGQRWPYVYNFFIRAQLPRFRVQLHSLSRVNLEDRFMQILEAEAQAAQAPAASGSSICATIRAAGWTSMRSASS